MENNSIKKILKPNPFKLVFSPILVLGFIILDVFLAPAHEVFGNLLIKKGFCDYGSMLIGCGINFRNDVSWFKLALVSVLCYLLISLFHRHLRKTRFKNLLNKFALVVAFAIFFVVFVSVYRSVWRGACVFGSGTYHKTRDCPGFFKPHTWRDFIVKSNGNYLK